MFSPISHARFECSFDSPSTFWNKYVNDKLYQLTNQNMANMMTDLTVTSVNKGPVRVKQTNYSKFFCEF